MREIEKLNINQLAKRYLESKNEYIFRVMYDLTLHHFKANLLSWGNNTTLANYHDILELFDDMVLSAIMDIDEQGGDFVKLLQCKLTNRYKSFLRKLATRKRREVFEAVPEDGASTSLNEISCDFVLEEEVISSINAKRKADQRQLIDFLVCGENERTTAIVQTFLSTDLKSPTAIGKHLGLDHKQVTRALHRLAAKYNTKQFGDYHDYLVAL